MAIPPIGAMPTPVAPAVSVPPAIAPVAPAPRSDSSADQDRRDEGRGQPPLYDRRGLAAPGGKGRLVSRKA